MFRTERVIDAAPAEIWELLTDAERYPEWNRSVVSLSGQIAEGETVKLVAAVSPKRTFALHVRDLEAGSRMVWEGGMPLGLFVGVRTFELHPLPDETTRFSMREEYRGALAPLIARSIPDLSESFDEFADCLKAASEAASSRP